MDLRYPIVHPNFHSLIILRISQGEYILFSASIFVGLPDDEIRGGAKYFGGITIEFPAETSDKFVLEAVAEKNSSDDSKM